jgi:two-component system cell cycle sensor histidine kinase/response regulator CckA
VTTTRFPTDELAEFAAECDPLFNGHPLPMWVYDVATLNFLAVNEAALRAYGYTREEFLAMSLRDIRSSDEQHVLAGINPSMPPLPRRRVRHMDRMGIELDVEVMSTPVKFRGRPARLVSALDITKTEAARRESEERFRALVEHASEMVLVVDAKARLTFISEASSTVLGYPPEQVLGKDALSFAHPDDAATARIALQESITRPGAVLRREFRALHKSGEVRVLACIIRNMLDHPAIRGVVINARDVTLQRQAEVALREREEELLQAQKMEAVGRLAGGIAHDFNNVLTAINGHAEFLAEMFDAGDPAHYDIDGIRNSAERAARLTRQLLAFSRRQVMQPSVIDLRLVISNIDQMLRRLIGEHIEMTCVVPQEPTLVHADQTQIEQVVLNLVMNARDAMPKGGTVQLSVKIADMTELSVGREPQMLPGRYAVISVEDTGTGIPAELIDKVFEPFFTTKDQGKGSGLGLSTVYGIVKQSGGHVLVHSEPGAGTRFDVLLHLVEDVSKATASTSAAESDVAPVCTVLLVEDENSVRLMAERVLRRQGYHVLTATDGANALDVLRDHEGVVDVVVTDVVMPVMSGRELANILADRYPNLPILFMSGYTGDEINEEGIKAAGAEFLAKPFAPSELAQLVRTMLDERK